MFKIMRFLLLLSLFLIFVFEKTESSTGFRSTYYSPQPDVCQAAPKGGVPWIIHVRDSNYGWKEHTARAMISLAMNDYFDIDSKSDSERDDIMKMTLQLEVELTQTLFRNRTHVIHDSDLALYIHALLATNKNPRDFHGVDLVADLLHRVKSVSGRINPFLLLALCNSHVIDYSDFIKVREISNLSHVITSNPGVVHPDVDSRIVQLKALAYKALACAIKYEPKLKATFFEDMKTITDCLHHKYNEKDGHFGNVYTTSLAVQAFTAVPDPPTWWDERKSLEYLERESEIDVNLIKAYYIEMALKARKYNFIRDIYKGVLTPGSIPALPNTYYVQYTIKKAHAPAMYTTLSLRMESGTNFYEVMKMASNYSAVFNFSAYENQDGDPMVYSVSGIPNDPEVNTFWRLCREYAVNHTYHTSIIDSIPESPAKFFPEEADHMVYMYGNAECPKKAASKFPH